MTPWDIVDGPFEYYESATDAIAVGWSWDIKRCDQRRVIRVEIAKSATAQLRFDDAERALQEVLHEYDPPARLLLGHAGISRSSSFADARRSA
jgi:hypothetical protein